MALCRGDEFGKDFRKVSDCRPSVPPERRDWTRSRAKVPQVPPLRRRVHRGPGWLGPRIGSMPSSSMRCLPMQCYRSAPLTVLTVLALNAAVASAAPIGYAQTNLTSSVAGLAANFDPNLKNPWG